MNKDLGFSEVRYHKFPQHVRCSSRMESVQEDDPSDEEPEGFDERVRQWIRRGETYRVYHGSLYPEV